MARRRIPSIDSLLSKLRKVDRDPPDVVLAFRLRMTPNGEWEARWNAAHWLEFDKGHEPPPGCLPPGVAEQIVKLMSYQAAQQAGGKAFASFGASFGRAALEELAGVLPHVAKFRGDK